MGYLRCKKCEGYYELQDGESPEDYDICYCGGELEYILSSEDMQRREYTEEDEFEAEERRRKSNRTLLIIILVVVVLLVLAIAIPTLLIYNSYFGGSSHLTPTDDINPVRSTRMMLPFFEYYL